MEQEILAQVMEPAVVVEQMLEVDLYLLMVQLVELVELEKQIV